MKISTGKLIDGNRLFIVYDENGEDRLRTTCFRGTHKKLAGNFSRWNSFSDFVYDRDFGIIKELSKSAERTYEECLREGRDSWIDVVTLDLQEEIGWESTNERYKFHNNNLEEFKLNERCEALRVKTRLTYIKAPKTSLVTIVYGIIINNGDITVYIRTIYPGVYIGPLYNEHGNGDVNITEREGRVFFDWNHPGE